MEEKLVILVVIGLISLVNWIIQRSSELREKRKLEKKRMGIPEGNPYRSQPEPAPPAPAAEPVAQRPAVEPAAEMRKLMEALGLPLEDEPPVVKRAPEPPLPVHPPLPVFEKTVQPVRMAVPAPRLAPKPALPATPAAVVTPRPRSPWAAALRSRDGVRQAVVLREILGPPKAFSL